MKRHVYTDTHVFIIGNHNCFSGKNNLSKFDHNKALKISSSKQMVFPNFEDQDIRLYLFSIVYNKITLKRQNSILE